MWSLASFLHFSSSLGLWHCLIVNRHAHSCSRCVSSFSPSLIEETPNRPPPFPPTHICVPACPGRNDGAGWKNPFLPARLCLSLPFIKTMAAGLLSHFYSSPVSFFGNFCTRVRAVTSLSTQVPPVAVRRWSSFFLDSFSPTPSPHKHKRYTHTRTL